MKRLQVTRRVWIGRKFTPQDERTPVALVAESPRVTTPTSHIGTPDAVNVPLAPSLLRIVSIETSGFDNLVRSAAKSKNEPPPIGAKRTPTTTTTTTARPMPVRAFIVESSALAAGP
jgi:hypothetical protein